MPLCMRSSRPQYPMQHSQRHSQLAEQASWISILQPCHSMLQSPSPPSRALTAGPAPQEMARARQSQSMSAVGHAKASLCLCSRVSRQRRHLSRRLVGQQGARCHRSPMAQPTLPQHTLLSSKGALRAAGQTQGAQWAVLAHCWLPVRPAQAGTLQRYWRSDQEQWCNSGCQPDSHRPAPWSTVGAVTRNRKQMARPP